MNYTGILSPDGSFIECESYEHLELAKEIAEKLNSEYSHKNGIVCEEYLQKLGYIIVRSRDVYGLIGYLDNDDKVIYLSDEQKKWLGMISNFDLKEIMDVLETARIYAGAEFERLCNDNQHIDACVFQSIRDSIAQNIQLLKSYVFCKAEKEEVNE